jgi:hypothetical protein
MESRARTLPRTPATTPEPIPLTPNPLPPQANQPQLTKRPVFKLLPPRKNDILGNLPEEDQLRVLDWIQQTSYRKAIEQIARPKPEGLNLKVHLTSLRRFHEKFAVRRDHDEPHPELDSLSFDEADAIIVRNLQRDIILGQDRLEDRAETIKLLNVYARFRGQDRKARRNPRSDWGRPKLQTYQIPPIDAGNLQTGSSAEPLNGNQEALSTKTPGEHNNPENSDRERNLKTVPQFKPVPTAIYSSEPFDPAQTNLENPPIANVS